MSQENNIISALRERAFTLPVENSKVKEFTHELYLWYNAHGRSLPWRSDPSPYNVFVSEIMLQQTQVPRVEEKYPPFISAFPDFQSLAKASFDEVLLQWKGLGYNRRARFLHKGAKSIVEEHGGTLPMDPEVLKTLPGIGPATASSMAAFAYNRPTLFIETNIRTFFIHIFFPHKENVSDSEIIPLVEAALDRDMPAKWYSALMDMGTHIKKNTANPSRKSKHHTVQSSFTGSRRQVRSWILDYIIEKGRGSEESILKAVTSKDHDVSSVVEDLHREGFIVMEEGEYRLSK
jgi:A/G-specific adenine glycosylase